jgi:hypothetical protein
VKPRVIRFYKVYCVCLCIFGLSLLALAAFSRDEPISLLLVEMARRDLILLGFAYLLLHTVALVSIRKPWAWVYGVVVLALSATSCFSPFAIPLLIYWCRRDAVTFLANEARGPGHERRQCGHE